MNPMNSVSFGGELLDNQFRSFWLVWGFLAVLQIIKTKKQTLG